ncbi:uncharacterized protein LOC121133343 isoform X2 [Mesocricetus auratus]|nr:uncharacterized protein LOC121133343 isoform X2 [Mesocricetus auratus]
MFSDMSSYPVMLFLITLLLSSILTEGRVVTQTKKEPTISADHMTNVKPELDKGDSQYKGTNTEDLHRVVSASHQDERSSEDLANTQKEIILSAVHLTNIKAVLDKVDRQGKRNNRGALERKLWASHRDERSSEDLTNFNQNMLDLSTVFTVLKKLCSHKHQVEPVNFSSIAYRSEGTGVEDQQENFKGKYIYALDEFLDLVASVLFSH